MQSGDVAVPDCVVIPVLPLVPSVKADSTIGMFCTAHVSVGEEDLSHWFGGVDISLGGELGCAVGVRAVAEIMMEGASVRAETLLHDTH